MNRIQPVLSGINSLIVRFHDRRTLLEEACRIARESGNFRMAWVGWLEDTRPALIPVAWAGMDEALLSKIRFCAGMARRKAPRWKAGPCEKSRPYSATTLLMKPP